MTTGIRYLSARRFTPRRGEIVRLPAGFTCISDVRGFADGYWQVQTVGGAPCLLERVLHDTGHSRIWAARASARDVLAARVTRACTERQHGPIVGVPRGCVPIVHY